jgi:hypothetical protein
VTAGRLRLYFGAFLRMLRSLIARSTLLGLRVSGWRLCIEVLERDLTAKSALCSASAMKGFVASTSWQKASTIYQIWPNSFCDSNGDGVGDLKGMTSKLDVLKDLGVDVLWLSPIYASPQLDMGYDISDYRAIHPLYGTMEDWEELLRGVHDRGMKLMCALAGAALSAHDSTAWTWS